MHRSKTEPTEEARRLSLPISWSLATPHHGSSLGKDAPHSSSFSIQLPKIRRVALTETEKDAVSEKILKMRKMGYDPVGCSKSQKLEKILLRKKINRPKAIFLGDSQQTQKPTLK